ncbi:MAG: DUF177 domain-containing protein [bacterium]|nr:DUF177 domain-containing protein [bacterium]
MLSAHLRIRAVTVLALDEFDEGQNRLEFEVAAEQLGLAGGDICYTAPVMVQMTVSKALYMYTVDGRVRTSVAGECCRCLLPAAVDLEARIRFLLQRKEASGIEVEAFEEQDDVDIVDPGTKEVDLSERLHDAVVLELPLRLYCKSDCKGLCPQCGQDFNVGTCSCAGDVIDPRWEALAHLKK